MKVTWRAFVLDKDSITTHNRPLLGTYLLRTLPCNSAGGCWDKLIGAPGKLNCYSFLVARMLRRWHSVVYDVEKKASAFHWLSSGAFSESVILFCTLHYSLLAGAGASSSETAQPDIFKVHPPTKATPAKG